MRNLFTAGSRILTYPEEYDNFIPNVTFAEYVLEKMQEFGTDISCVFTSRNSFNVLHTFINWLLIQQ